MPFAVPRIDDPNISGIIDPAAGRRAASLKSPAIYNQTYYFNLDSDLDICSFSRGSRYVLVTYPAATPILNITRCQYSLANPVNMPHTLNNMVQVAINLGLEKV